MLRNLPGIADLSLRGCQLSDRVTGPLALLTAVTRLDLRACEKFTGATLQVLSKMVHLRELHLKV